MTIEDNVHYWRFILVYVVWKCLFCVHAHIHRSKNGFVADFAVVNEGQLMGRVLEEMENAEIGYCMYMCVLHKKCKTINYNHETNICQVVQDAYDEANMKLSNLKWVNYATRAYHEGLCPRSHPYAFYYGLYCCKFDQEAFRGKRCKGSTLSHNSTCCYYNESVECKNRNCTKYTNAVKADICPENFPYPYLSGTHCCQTKREGTDLASGALCDGGELSYSSVCCEDGKYAKCGAVKCTENMECPKTHQYPYLYGSRCCKYNKEDNCDGSKLGNSSSCCLKDDFVKCKYNKCVSNEVALV